MAISVFTIFDDTYWAPAASVDDWDRLSGVNAKGTFLCYKYAAQQMIKQGRGGRIIGASPSSGKRGEHVVHEPVNWSRFEL